MPRNRWHYKETEKNTIDFKGIFLEKKRRQLKINNLEGKKRRRWVKNYLAP
jgi:hypothetical protein